MASIPTRVPVPGSDRAALPGARSTGPVDPGERIQVTVLVRPRASAQPSAEAIGSSPPSKRRHLTREEFSSAHGADASDLTKVEAFAHEHGLDVTEISAARRSVVLSGTVAAFSDAFGVALERYVHPGGTYRGRTGPVHVPAALADVVQGVFGLDDRPQAKPHNRRRNDAPGAQPHAAGTSYTPLEVARLYNFPNGDGRGQCIGIIELGGGYRAAELKSYFAQLGVHAPHVTAVSVDGAHNTPGVDTNADGEVLLDIEVAGAIAPGARLAVYFAPNTDSGFLDAITKAVHDTHRRPSVISISWGGPESSWTAQSLQAYDQALQAAAVLGVTVCCASG
ncbi:MAG TPA: protease pro-enzyme activation domain-containing protein, partial [Gemmatimonadales bacterium]|nr:protease pro-enzyme activation domain-containing protein [Gemmatimonadales bacterium]